MRKRINVMLPEETLRLLAKVASKGERSRLIDAAVRHYVGTKGRKNLKKLLQEGAAMRAERDIQIAEEFAAFQDEI